MKSTKNKTRSSRLPGYPKQSENERIFHKIYTVFGVGETQTFSNVALQRVLYSVGAWVLQSHAVVYNFE